MRYAAALLLASTLATAAQAETRIIAEANGWTAFGGTTDGGVATCGLETRDPNTGRHFLLQHLVGQDWPILRLSRPSWNLRAPSTRPVRIVIDNRRIFAAEATGAGREMSWPLALEGFDPAFRQGALMRIEFPAGPDTPWNLSLTGTNAVMGSFVGCMRMMVIQPGEAAPPAPPAPEPVQTPPPVPAPVEGPSSPAPEPGEPRLGLPGIKAVPDAPAVTTPATPTPGPKDGPKPGPDTQL